MILGLKATTTRDKAALASRQDAAANLSPCGRDGREAPVRAANIATPGSWTTRTLRPGHASVGHQNSRSLGASVPSLALTRPSLKAGPRSRCAPSISDFRFVSKKNSVTTCAAPPQAHERCANTPLQPNACSGPACATGGWPASNFDDKSRLRNGLSISSAPKSEWRSSWTAPVTGLRRANAAIESGQSNCRRKVCGSFVSGTARSCGIWSRSSTRSSGNWTRRNRAGLRVRWVRRSTRARRVTCPHWRCASVSPTGREGCGGSVTGDRHWFLHRMLSRSSRGAEGKWLGQIDPCRTTGERNGSVPNCKEGAAANLSPCGRDGRAAPVRALPVRAATENPQPAGEAEKPK